MTLILVLVMLLSGCATLFEDVAIKKAEDEGKLKIGMSYAEVVQIVGRSPSGYADLVTKEQTASGEYYIWVVNGGPGGTNWARTYTFRFRNGRLESWGCR